MRVPVERALEAEEGVVDLERQRLERALRDLASALAHPPHHPLPPFFQQQHRRRERCQERPFPKAKRRETEKARQERRIDKTEEQDNLG
jgi:hypothetical protein